MSPGCAIVTEGSRGLGLGIAAALAETGRPVVIAACDPQDLRNAAAELEAKGADVLASRPDITDGRAVGELVRHVVERFARIDVLVNNAGGRSPEPAHDCRDPGNPRFGNG
jgi:NAD(P)-dependent dehydrogenase (short-subunit alcohol dehydrogenase family)